MGNFLVVVRCTDMIDLREKILGQYSYCTLKVRFSVRFESRRIAANRIWLGFPTAWSTAIEGFKVLDCHCHSNREI